MSSRSSDSQPPESASNTNRGAITRSHKIINGKPKRWDGLIIGLVCLIVGNLLPRPEAVFSVITKIKQNAAQIKRIDQEITTRLAYFATSLASAKDMIGASGFDYKRHNQRCFFTLTLPVLVVSDGTLWAAITTRVVWQHLILNRWRNAQSLLVKSIGLGRDYGVSTTQYPICTFSH